MIPESEASAYRLAAYDALRDLDAYAEQAGDDAHAGPLAVRARLTRDLALLDRAARPQVIDPVTGQPGTTTMHLAEPDDTGVPGESWWERQAREHPDDEHAQTTARLLRTATPDEPAEDYQ